MAKKVRDVMSPDAKCVKVGDTITEAARQLAQLDVGAMPICGDDDRLKGMLTDRDIVVKVIAAGKNPDECRVADFAEGKPWTIGADDSTDEALKTMSEHAIRRLPVIDDHRLVGIVSQADLAREVDEEKVGELLEAISTAP